MSKSKVNQKKLLNSREGLVWAKEFAKVQPDVDQELSLGWFANLSETAYRMGYSDAMQNVAEVDENDEVCNDCVLDDLMCLPWTRQLVPDEDCISASILELPGCYSEGETFQDALLNLEEVLFIWLESALENDECIPDPSFVRSNHD